ncbi:endonuclease V [Flavobacterium sp. NRK F7]|uniref:endonuclease V n=1 Tax=Flavobacterium sp. NRK F7 TaxID=2954930 RepID=UPI002091A49D|nr:endonuclease V [Flavobacterium sp. NRK F7]MCO6164550.1 endonuclease V [Flavobacterium sp. NRK F7]
MENFYIQEEKENFNEFDHPSLKIHNGFLFTGVYESLNQNAYSRITFVKGVMHGVYLYFNNNGCSVNIKLFDKTRFNVQYNYNYPNIDDNNNYLLCYDFISLSRKYNVLGQKEETFGENNLFKREELNYDDLIKKNIDIIEKYNSYIEEGEHMDYDTFVYCHGDIERYAKVFSAYLIQKDMKEYLGETFPDTFMEKFVWQEEQIPFISQEDNLSLEIRYLGGVSVGFHDISQKAVATITVFDVEKQEIVDVVTHSEEDVTMHIPDLFAFNEIKWVLKAYDKLTIKPQLLFCDGHGLEHPRNMGLATFLGIQLNLPTIGVAKKRLVGYYDKETLGKEKGDSTTLLYDSKVVGKALRTQISENPVYVSAGNKISLETSIEWVKKMTVDSRVPFVLENAIQKTRELLPEQFRIDFLNDEPNNNGIII